MPNRGRQVAGLPPSANTDDVVAFFDRMEFPPDKVIMDVSGSAYVRFPAESDVFDAIEIIRQQRTPSSAVLPRKASNWDVGPQAMEAEPPRGWPEAADIEQFLVENEVDANAADALRQAPHELQESCLRRGNLRGVRNPSAALLSRLRNPQNSNGSRRFGGASGSLPREKGPVADDVEDFLLHYRVDSMACEAFRRCRRDIQVAVIEKGLEGAGIFEVIIWWSSGAVFSLISFCLCFYFSFTSFISFRT